MIQIGTCEKIILKLRQDDGGNSDPSGLSYHIHHLPKEVKNLKISVLRKKYPDFFVNVEAAVYHDCTDRSTMNTFVAKKIAYNAAAVAVVELHKILKSKVKA